MKKVIFVLVGMLVGVSFVRLFVLDFVEAMVWSLFWSGDIKNSDSILSSTTFMKSITGLLIGGGIGYLIALFSKKNKK